MSSKNSAPEGVFEEGTVRWYSVAKGYGFLTREGSGEDVFVHHSEITDPEPDDFPLEVGERVRFLLSEGPKGLSALRVARVQD